MSTEQQASVATNEEVAKVNEEAPVDTSVTSEQTTTTTAVEPQVEQVSKDGQATEEQKEDTDQTVEPAADDKPVDVSASGNVAEKVENGDSKVVDTPTADETVESDDTKHSETAAENGNNKAAENGKSKEVEVETNGVCKRKEADDVSEAVEAGDKTESSPKKVKVVNDGEQAPTEETAA